MRAWRRALAWEGPSPTTLMAWYGVPPSRQDMGCQIECPDEWQGQVTSDEIGTARGVLWFLVTEPEYKIPSHLPSSRND